MKNIFILPTDKPSRFWVTNLGNLARCQDVEPIKKALGNNVNIYIISNEEIKEGDWCLSTDKNFIIKLVNLPAFSCDRKIIITDNQDLIKDGVQPIDDEFLEWFVKNPSCEFVEVTYNKDAFPYGVETSKKYGWFKIIIPQEEPKTNLEKLPFPELIEELVNYHKDTFLVEENNFQKMEEAAKKYANIPLDRTVDTEERYFNDATREYDAFIAGAEWHRKQHLPPNKLDT
jgi:hypothetical protein